MKYSHTFPHSRMRTFFLLTVGTLAILLSGCKPAPQTEAAIKEELAEANYCETESDCTLIGSKCPFDCYIYVNKNEADRMKQIVDDFPSDCTYSCIQSFGVACNQGTCEAITEPPPSEEETTDDETADGNIGSACESSEECVTPMSYLTRSSCPFGSACIEGQCGVVCPMWEHSTEPNASISYEVPCETDADCDCSGYAGPRESCKCIDKMCVAVVETK